MQTPLKGRPRPRLRVVIPGLFSAGMLLIVVVLSVAMHWWDADIAFSRVWWHPPHKWFGDRSAVCWLLNEFGAWPGVLLAIGAFVVLVVALLRKSQRRRAAPALYLVAAFLIGPGILVNGMLKHTWPRARPKEMTEFRGKLPYEMVLTRVDGSTGRSFPSGHASAAFFLCALGFASAAWGTRQGVWAGLALGVAWGGVVGWSRIASGAHFMSDVLWSGALVNTVNFLVLVPFLIRERRLYTQRAETIDPAEERPMKAFF